MPELGKFSRELRAKLWKPAVADEVHDEVQAHLEELEQHLVAQGLAPDEARREARRRFGSTAAIEAECRTIGEQRDNEFRFRRLIDEARQDTKQALRQLRRAPRFAFAAIATLAIGLGAATTIFSLANAVLFRPLPFAEPKRLLLLNEVTPDGSQFSVSEPNYLDWSSRARSFTSLAAFTRRNATLTGEGDPEMVSGALATHTLFTTLGVTPLRGRSFLPEEDTRGGDTRVAIISHDLWQRRFGADPAILEKRVDIDGVGYRVVGVVPDEQAMPSDADLWLPLVPSLEDNRADRRLDVVARLRDGVSAGQAGEELAAIARELAQRFPNENDQWTATVRPFREAFVSPQFEQRVLALLATVVLLLAMACINVGNLLLSRAATRSREIAVRSALGAGSRRLARQLITESLVLAAVGVVAGTLLTAAAVPVLRRIAGDSVSRLDGLTMDWRVLMFAAASSLVSGLFFGTAPALRARRSRASLETLRSGSRLAPGGRARNGLVVASVALATVLLICASLVGRSFLALMRVDLGFDARGVTIASVSTANDRYDEQRSVEFLSALVRDMQRAPGVDAAGAVVTPPFGQTNFSQSFIRAELANPERAGYRLGSWRAVTPGYFETLRIPILRGRAFDETDRTDRDVPSVVINETLARQAFGDEDPIGRSLASSNGQVKTVIGVVRDTRHLYLDSLPNPTMYWAHAQFPWRVMWLVVRGDGDIAGLLRQKVHALDPLLPVAEVRTLTSLVDDRSAEARLTMLVFTIFATAALVLVAVGLYGVVSYTVTNRTREIGVTLALGARPAGVVQGIVGSGLRLSVAGVAIGLALSAAATGFLRAILYEVQPTDVSTFAAVGVLLMLIAALASAGPAWRAAKLDPVVALRSE